MTNRENLPVGEARSPQFFYGWFVVLAIFFTMVVMWGTLYTFGVFFEPVSTEFNWTRAMTSGAYSLYVVLHGFLYIITGSLNDRFGPRVVMSACGFFLGLGYLLMSRISAIWQLYLFYGVVIGIGMSGSFVPLVSTVSKWFVKRRGVMTGFVVSGIGVGTVIMPPLASQLISSYGWRSSYIIVGSIALVLVILAAQFLRRDPAQVGQLPYGEDEVGGEESNLEARGFSLGEAIRTRQFWMLGAIFFGFIFTVQTIMVHIVLHAQGLGISPATAASILAVIGGIGIAGRIIIGSAADKISSKLCLIIVFILALAVLFWLVVAKETWALFLFAAIFGFAYGGFVALTSLLVAELFGLSSHGVILGIITFVGTIGGATGPVVAGHIFDITNSYQPAFLVCAALGVIGVGLASLLQPTSNKGGNV